MHNGCAQRAELVFRQCELSRLGRQGSGFWLGQGWGDGALPSTELFRRSATTLAVRACHTMLQVHRLGPVDNDSIKKQPPLDGMCTLCCWILWDNLEVM